MAEENKGYTRSFRPLKLRKERLTVHCKRCNNTWEEDVEHYGIFAGYARDYDYCSKCITPEDQAETESEDKNRCGLCTDEKPCNFEGCKNDLTKK
jgi:hypothetical protein